MANAEPRVGNRVSLTVVMPGLDEEASVAAAVARTREALEKCTDEFEIIVIDDGSTDRMGEIAADLAAQDARIRLIRNERNLNYGISLRRGIAAARCEWVLHNGMDLPLAPEDFEKFTPHFDGADVLVARRLDRSAHSPWRTLTSLVNNRLLRILFAPRARDLNFTQFYRREFAQGVRLRSTSPAFVTPELILRAERNGLRVREIEVEFRRRRAGRAHFGRPKDILWTLRDMLALRIATWHRGWKS
jgi:glycosyltransferase involved in cell wall biosynthesis